MDYNVFPPLGVQYCILLSFELVYFLLLGFSRRHAVYQLIYLI